MSRALLRFLRFTVLDRSDHPRRAPRHPRRGPLRDANYLVFIRRQPCCCGCGRGPCDAAHTGPHAIGLKASDFRCIPLWRECHQEMHRIGQAAFEGLRGISIENVVEGMNTEWSAR